MSDEPLARSLAGIGIRFNEHMEGACKLGLEGIVSKRKDSAYRSGRSPDWLKMKNMGCSCPTFRKTVRPSAGGLPFVVST
jgi:hypothetical protein